MAINITIDNDVISTEEKNRLTTLFNIQPTNSEAFDNAIKGVILAALTEYKEMMLGKGLPTRAIEIREHRLLHLIKHFFVGRIPTESEVSSMFQLTESESRSLIKNVRYRFRYLLADEIRLTLIQVINNARQPQAEQPYRVEIQSENVLDELNQLIGRHAAHLDPIVKARGTTKIYEIEPDTYDALNDIFALIQNNQPTNQGEVE